MRSKNFDISSYPTIQNYLFRAVILTKNADIDKCKYSGYGTVFDRHGFYSLPSDGTGRNVIILTKIDNRKKDILILVKGTTQGLEKTLRAEKIYSINFTENNKKKLFKLAL